MGIRCFLGFHDFKRIGRLHNGCSRCRCEWYIDYFGSVDAGRTMRYMVVDENGRDLPEKKRWTGFGQKK